MTTLRWSVVVPVKSVRAAKSRLLGWPDQLREDLVVAMAADTVAAAGASLAVATVYVVTDDPAAAAAASTAGAVVVADEPDAGLNRALAHGARTAARVRPDHGVAALSADLPALRSEDLTAALGQAGGHRRALVADAEGKGTTLLTAAPGVPLAPAYGMDSRRRHLDRGAVELSLDGCHGLRRDVDTAADLAAAERLGVGPQTRQVLASRAAGSPPAR